jgi:uncharacterized protein
MVKKIDKIRKLVKNRFEEDDWKYHMLPVLKYAKQLAKEYKVNKEVVELATLLHDIGRVNIKDDEEHHIIGVPRAEKMLRKFNYPEKVIKEVKHCVGSHRTSKGPKPKTTIAKIIANADAMAHFDTLPVFFYWRGRRGYGVEEITRWVENKIKKDWQKKITLPKAKKIVENKYKAIQLLLNSLKKYEKEK